MKGQTAIEYLLLAGGSVLLVAVVAWFVKTRVLA
ncbi:MAG: class III signal peptide-containing protein [Candidatus Micrarchaeota archaeon]